MRNDKSKQNAMTFGFKSSFVRKTGGFIDTVSPTIQHDLTPGQKVTGLNVPLQSLGNSVIDDMHRDLFWAIYLANSNLKEIAPEGRESVRGLLEWVLSDPNFKATMMSMCNLKVSSASAAYVLVEQLLNMPEVSQSMSGFGKAEDMEDQADNLDQQAQDQMSGEGGGEQGEDDAENQSGNAQDGQDEQDPNSDPSEDDSDEQGGSGSDSENDYEDDEQAMGGDYGGQDEGEAEPQMTPEQMQAMADKLREQAQNIREKAAQMLDELTGNETKAGQFGRAGAVKTGADFGDNVASFLSSWGIDEGKGLMLSPEQILEIMKAFSSTGIAALTALIGRIYGVASETLRGRAPVQVVAEDAGYTKDILSMHPAERYRLTTGYPGRQQAIEDWLKRGLGGITKTMQSVREGNFVCFVDGSGSMGHEEQGGTREQIAKELALGLSKAAIENGQEILLSTFGSHGELTDLVDNRTSFEKRLEWATFMFDGGTDFDFALEKMMDLIDSYDEQERFRTDLVIITDGEAGVSELTKDRLLQLKDQYGVRLFCLMIGGGSHYSYGDDLIEVSDKILKFDNVDHVAQTLSESLWV